MQKNHAIKRDITEFAAYRYSDSLPAESRMLEELLKGTEIQQLFENYYKFIQIPVAVIDLKANVLFSSRWQRICTQFHRANPETCKRCVASDTTLAAQLTQGTRHAIFPCKNGLTDCASPIVIDGKYVANVFVGQFMTQKPDEARFRSQAAEFGFPVEEYLAAVREVPVVDETRVPLILDLLAQMTRVITNLSADRKRTVESQELVRGIIEGTPDFIWTVDPVNFGIITANTTFREYFSRSRGITDLTGKRPEDLFPDRNFIDWWQNAFASALRDGKYSAEYTTYKSDITLLLELTLLKREGQPFAISIFGKNITDRKKAEEKYRVLFDSAHDGIALADAETGVLLDCNQALCRLVSREKEELVGQSHALLHPQGPGQDKNADTFNRHKESGPDIPLEDVLLSKDGKTLPVEIRASKFTLDGREVMLGLFRDIADRKKAEAMLRDKELKYRALFETASDAILLFADGKWIDCNMAAGRVFGCTREDILGAHPKKFSPPVQPDGKDSMEEAPRLIGLAYEGQPQSFSWTHCRLDGTPFFAEVNLNRVDLTGKPHIQAIVRDVTARKQAENRQALYLSVLKRLGDGEASDAVIKDILDYVAESLDVEAVGIRLERDGDFPFLFTRGFTSDFVSKEKTLCKRAQSGELIRDADGHTVFQCTCGAVVSGRLGEDLPFMTKGGSLWVKSISSLTAPELESVISRLVDFRGRCVDEGFESLALIPLRSKEKIIGLMHIADHRKGRVSLELAEFLEGLGSSVALVLERREAALTKSRLEEQILQAQKMESVGRLAGGVAHDFNNLLTAISGYGSILMRSLEEKDPRREDLGEMLEAAQRGAALTQQLLAFSRKQVLNVVALDLNSAVENTLKMLKRVIGEDIKVKTELAPMPCLIRTDAGQIGQVIMNLAVNARDAMPKGGTLRISTKVATMPESFFAANPGLTPGPLVAMRVADNGCGMTEEIKQRIFEPFFTTKEQGKGTGLGLPTVYGIVTQSGGTVQLDTEPGKGTTFTLYFPQCASAHADAQEKAQSGACRGDFKGRGEKILLVEDDEALRRLGERVLKDAGYTVVTALDGQDALCVLEKLGGAVDLVVTDVVMPGMTGKDLAKEILKRGAARKILFVSGYTDEILSKEGEVGAGTELLSKPFSPELLLRKVCEMLHKTKG